MAKYTAIVLSAGKGSRMGSSVHKQYLLLCGRPVIYYTLKAFEESPVDEIVLVTGEGEEEYCRKEIVEKYNLNISEDVKKLMDIETPKKLDNVTTFINGSVRELCSAVSRECSKYGYEPVMLTDQLCCQAKEAGSFLASIAKTHCKSGKKLAYIAGGETVVNITGHGKGGRNQEIALSAAEGIKDIANAAVFSIGSDGTDGPTDAAGGYSDGDTAGVLKNKGIDIFEVLKNNDAYNALKLTGGLIITGPTGTNVNDVSVLLIG